MITGNKMFLGIFSSFTNTRMEKNSQIIIMTFATSRQAKINVIKSVF